MQASPDAALEPRDSLTQIVVQNASLSRILSLAMILVAGLGESHWARLASPSGWARLASDPNQRCEFEIVLGTPNHQNDWNMLQKHNNNIKCILFSIPNRGRNIVFWSIDVTKTMKIDGFAKKLATQTSQIAAIWNHAIWNRAIWISNRAIWDS